MTVVWLMLPIALLLSFGFLAGFLWVASQGDYEDLETPAQRILFDEER